jgi:hypothetical protein
MTRRWWLALCGALGMKEQDDQLRDGTKGIRKYGKHGK